MIAIRKTGKSPYSRINESKVMVLEKKVVEEKISYGSGF